MNQNTLKHSILVQKSPVARSKVFQQLINLTQKFAACFQPKFFYCTFWLLQLIIPLLARLKSPLLLHFCCSCQQRQTSTTSTLIKAFSIIQCVFQSLHRFHGSSINPLQFSAYDLLPFYQCKFVAGKSLPFISATHSCSLSFCQFQSACDDPEKQI